MAERAAAPAQRLETATIVLTGALVDLFPGAERHLELAVSDVGELVDVLDERWPGMGDRVRDSRPAIRRHINVFVDGRKATLETPIAPGARVFVLTAMSGG